jgi:diguanylate cyclase (GGDEF)-like protein
MARDERDRTLNAKKPSGRSPQSRSFLLVLSGAQLGEMFELEPGHSSVLGRKQGVEVMIRDGGVSRRHATITVEGDGARLKDLESQNGTFVDGIHIGVSTVLKFVQADEVEAEFQRKLSRGALHEPLTGLYNRLHFMERLTSELAAAQRHKRALSLLLIDVDHFKGVNDEHGHLAGDEALKMVARVLQSTVRKEDVVARYGGEEFVVLARETAMTGGRALAERVRKAVERSRYTWQGHDLNLTVSIGVTVSIGLTQFEPGRSDREILEAADKALYRAKQKGRNCVVALPLVTGA